MLKLGDHQMLFVLLLCVALTIGHPQDSAAKRDCGPNAEWTTCGRACPATCNEPSRTRPCTLQCLVGCQCLPGYVLNGQQQCVSPKQC